MMKVLIGVVLIGDDGDVTRDGDDGAVIESDDNIMTMTIPRMEDDEQHS